MKLRKITALAMAALMVAALPVAAEEAKTGDQNGDGKIVVGYISKNLVDPFHAPINDAAEAQLEAMVEEGIIDGYGDGKFGPSDPLTGYQWAKMLVAAYDCIPVNEDGEPIETLTGSAWQIKTAKYAVQLGLWEGDDSVKTEPDSDFMAQCAQWKSKFEIKYDI